MRSLASFATAFTLRRLLLLLLLLLLHLLHHTTQHIHQQFLNSQLAAQFTPVE